ncbi:MAG: TonB-dependent receptor [Salinivenus sp.]
MIAFASMPWRRVLLVAVVFTFSLNHVPARAQDQPRGRVEGRVVAVDETPLLNATVRIVEDDASAGTTTGADGRFALDGVAPGSVTLRVRHVGYEAATRAVRVRPGQTARVTIELTATTVELDGIEITSAGRQVQAALPGAATTVAPADLDAMAPIGSQEALTYVPGVYGVADDGMGQTRMSVGIRGLQPRRTQRVLVMEDGMPIQPAPYVFSPLYYNPPIERIEEVEVVKGSATIRHGPQTMAGVLNYVTRRPRRTTPGGSLQLKTGSNRYASVYGEVGGFGTEALRPKVEVLFKRGDGYRDNNDFWQLNGTAKLRAQIDEDRSLYLKSNVDYERLNATYTGVTPYTLRTNPDFNPKEDDFYRIFRASVGAIYNRRYSDAVEGTTRLYANVFDRPWWRENDVFVRADDYEQNGGDAEPVSPSTPGPLVRVGVSDVVENPNTPYFGNERTFYAGGLEHTLDVEHRLAGGDATLELGGRLHWERFRDTRRISDEVGAREGVFFRGDPSDPSSIEILGENTTYETTALALYALESVRWGPLRLDPGLRLEIFEQERVDRLAGGLYRDETSVVPLPGLGFNLNLGRYDLGPYGGDGQFNLFGGVHRGYTPPSSATFQIVGFGDPEAVADDEDGLDLRAEKSWNSELGLRGRTDAVDLEVTGFHLYVEDLVGGRTAFRQNLGVVQSYGLEARGTLDAGVWADPLPTLRGSYTYLQTEVLEGVVSRALGTGQVDISGNELPSAPRHTATVGLTQPVPALPLTLRADLRYVDAFYTDLENLESTTNRGERGPVPSHTVLDAGAVYTVSDALRLQLTAKNVTDHVFVGSRLHSNPREPTAAGSTGILPGPRRQINLSVNYDF